MAEFGRPVTFYLEGDGNAWITRTRPSPNPTPRDPIGLRLAARDRSANVVYVARPCQYWGRELDADCNTTYWTDRRMAPEVVASIDAAVDVWKSRAGADKIRLVGYSGGGGIAVLLASRRSDVDDIRTIAANLDTERFTSHHRVSPMRGSSNPAAVASQVAHIPQLHLVGAEDRIVPALIAGGYAAAARDGRCIRIAVIPGVSHTGDWSSVWETWQHIAPPRC